jgi:hypothetical protein
MNIYKCELIQTRNGIRHVEECFYRQGNSEQEVKEGLEMFQWPKGKWRVELE